MKKSLVMFFVLALGMSAMAQQKIQLRSTDKAECVKSDFTSLKASFSFSGLEAYEMTNERGVFSTLTMPNTVMGGNEGAPQIPVINELIAVPFGAQPRIEITSFSTTDYRLEDYDIHTLSPRQPSLRKDQDPDEVPFVYNASAYQTRGLSSTPAARVSVEGTMRGVQLGKMTIEPVSYDAVNNTLRVFNDIEVEVHFDGADVRATEEKLLQTYSPYFNGLYKQLFNGRAVLDAYSDHPDLYTTPVKMMVVTTSTYANTAVFQEWVNWKRLKGIYTTVYTTNETGATAASITSFIQNKYNADAPTFLVIVGDDDSSNGVVRSATGTQSAKATDLYYSSPDGDIFPDMYTSRMPVSSTTELSNLLNKIMTYEQYTMADPSYLNDVLLIAGWDSNWTPRVGTPTIQYAVNYYYNAEHGFSNVHDYYSSGSGQTSCYNYINSVGFVNYTAHGSETGWADPSFSVSSVSTMTNNDKYFWAMGNCCLAADWGYSGTCFGEAMVRAQNKGAFGYIGSCPSTYWYEDYYFGVGATNIFSQMPTQSQTTDGVYESIFDDDEFNTLNSVPYFGNIAVTYSHANGYSASVNDTYYWEAYHTLGDGSVMPYHVQPTANNVSHMDVLPMGMETFDVSAVPGSYVAISKDGVILGTALVGTSGTVQVPITPVTNSGDVTICVTAPQRIPYIQTVIAAALEGAYITVDSYTPTNTHVGDDTDLSITFKNVGNDPTSGITTVTLASNDTNVTILNGTMTFNALASNATTTVNGFRFRINPGVEDGTPVTIHYTAVNGSDTWEGDFAITANAAVLEYQGLVWDGSFTPGQTLTLSAQFKNTGHYQASNAVATLTSSSSYITIDNPTLTVGNIDVDQTVTCNFTVTIAPDCPETAQIPVAFTLTADGGLAASGSETLKNSCNVTFNLADSYGDGWNGASLTVSFDDGTPSQSLTVSSGYSASYTLEIGNGVHVTLTWTKGSYDSECSFTVSYDGDLVFFSQGANPSAGTLFEFDCNCAAASQTFTVTVDSNNEAQGSATGGGEFTYGQSCTVTATPNEGFMFSYWTLNGEALAGAPSTYSFYVTSDAHLVAHFAEGTLIGDNGTATNSYLPSYSYYNYTLSQQIYTVEELGSAGMITSIAFYNGGSTKTRSYDFYLKATDKTSFSGTSDWIAVTEDDRVFSGSVTMTENDWIFIAFDTPFIYDGTTNLVLVADDNTGSYSSGMACRVFDAPGQAIYIYSDNTDYNPFAPSSYGGTILNVKNQLLLTKDNEISGCVKPINVEVDNITHNAATVSWDGNSDSYLVQLGLHNSTSLVNESFDGTLPADWTNDPTYPWTIVDGHMQSGNAGVASSASSISLSVSFNGYGTVEFDAECRGEGSSTIWDKCSFSIDGNEMFAYGANVSGWNHYSFNLSPGSHSFAWSYAKDGSVDPSGDYFAVDNLLIYTEETVWLEPLPSDSDLLTLSGLSPETSYCVRVRGLCDGNETDWSSTVLFTTAELTSLTQTVALSAGTNWFSTYVEITLDDLQAALVATGNTSITIASQTQSVSYQNGRWRGSLAFDVSQMYKITVGNDCEISLVGPAIVPAEHPVTIRYGSNWIAFPFATTMSLDDAFDGFAVQGDMVKSQSGTATFIRNHWIGAVDLLPGKGYIYQSANEDDRTLVFPESAD